MSIGATAKFTFLDEMFPLFQHADDPKQAKRVLLESGDVLLFQGYVQPSAINHPIRVLKRSWTARQLSSSFVGL